jgi:hypothetical protein
MTGVAFSLGDGGVVTNTWTPELSPSEFEPESEPDGNDDSRGFCGADMVEDWYKGTN